MENLYDALTYECTVDGLPLNGNEDKAFDIPTEFYWFIKDAVLYNFEEIWGKECAKLNHKPEFEVEQTQLMSPFFRGCYL